MGLTRKKNHKISSFQDQLGGGTGGGSKFLSIRLRFEGRRFPECIGSSQVDGFHPLDHVLDVDGLRVVFPSAEFAGLRGVALHIDEPAGLPELMDALRYRATVIRHPLEGAQEHRGMDKRFPLGAIGEAGKEHGSEMSSLYTLASSHASTSLL